MRKKKHFYISMMMIMIMMKMIKKTFWWRNFFAWDSYLPAMKNNNNRITTKNIFSVTSLLCVQNQSLFLYHWNFNFKRKLFPHLLDENMIFVELLMLGLTTEKKYEVEHWQTECILSARKKFSFSFYYSNKLKTCWFSDDIHKCNEWILLFFAQ